MEKQSRKQSSKPGNSANKTNSKTNKNLYISKIREVKKTLEKKSKEIIVPIMKIQKKISLKFDIFIKDYNEIIKKAETANKEIITHLEENKNDSMNITDIQLNQKYAINHENMIKFYKNVADKLELFTNLINSNEYDNLLKEYLTSYQDKDIDAIVLGCTHYPIIKDKIQKFFPSAKLLDGNNGVARRVKYQLETHNILNNKTTNGIVKFIQTKKKI